MRPEDNMVDDTPCPACLISYCSKALSFESPPTSAGLLLQCLHRTSEASKRQICPTNVEKALAQRGCTDGASRLLTRQYARSSGSVVLRLAAQRILSSTEYSLRASKFSITSAGMPVMSDSRALRRCESHPLGSWNTQSVPLRGHL